MSVRPTLRCPCGEQTLNSAFAYQAPPRGETVFDLGTQVYRRSYGSCGICGHWFGKHDLDLSLLYSHDYVTATYGGADGMRARFERIRALPAHRSDNQQRVARILAFAAERGFAERAGAPRLLDVGAGLGVFPAAMQAAGWAALGLEPDARTVRHLEEVAGVKARHADLFDLDREVEGAFDAVTFNKVLEHVEDPVAMLSAGGALLAAYGFVYVEVPDVAAAEAGAEREEFFIEHHHVFSPASLVLLAERAGLKVARLERLREPSGKYTLVTFLIPRGADA